MRKRILSMVIGISMLLAVGCGNTETTPVNNEQAADAMVESVGGESAAEEASAHTEEAREEDAAAPVETASADVSSSDVAYLDASRKAVEGARNDSGNYQLVVKESTITIDGDVNSAVITPDRTKILVVMNDGETYVTNPEQTARKGIDIQLFSDDGWSVVNADYVYNDGAIVYDSASSGMYRISFDDCSVWKFPLDKMEMAGYAPNSANIIYSISGDGIYIFKASDHDPQKIYDLSEDSQIYNGVISDDGEFAVWSGYDMTGVYSSGKVTVINEGCISLELSNDQQSCFCSNQGGTYVVDRNGNVQR